MVRFNWPKYAGGITALLALLILSWATDGMASRAWATFAALAGVALLLPIGASHFIYDRSNLYQLEWLDPLGPGWGGTLLNISAGFDETTRQLRTRFKLATVHALDFYDPQEHTEPSIERARRFTDGSPESCPITTARIPFESGSVDRVLCFLSLHEVRSPQERSCFLAEVRRVLKTDGRLIVTEHLRDAPNFFAFNVGFLHFHSRSTWEHAFHKAGFTLEQALRTTPFVTTFILRPS